MNNLANIIESILFISGKEVAIKDIAEKLELPESKIKEAIEQLKAKYSGECGLHLLTFNKKVQFSSNPVYAEDVSKVLNPILEKEFTKTILEVCAIIAYRQPITKTEIEFIKGAKSCDYAVQTLLSLSMIEPVGRKDAVGRPILYGTTDNFLKRFRLESLNDLPDYDMMMESIKNMRKDADEYLFKKDEYVEEQAEESQAKGNDENDNLKQIIEEVAVSIDESAVAASAESDDEFEENELPDFLKNEDIVVIN